VWSLKLHAVVWDQALLNTTEITEFEMSLVRLHGHGRKPHATFLRIECVLSINSRQSGANIKSLLTGVMIIAMETL
jgi:hypothetical protein